jgi:hypothetical protein
VDGSVAESVQTPAPPNPKLPAEIPQGANPLPIPSVHPEVERIAAAVGGEREELVALPWRLQANAGLSYLAIDGGMPSAVAVRGREMPPAAESLPTEPDAFFTFAPLNASIEAGEWLRSVQPAVAAKQVHASSERAASTEAMRAMTAGTAASVAWPERLLRWIADPQGQGVTAWVRDFGIEPSQLQRMVDSLRDLARQQGQQLHRVVLNGHELWRSSPTTDTATRG